jgi:hypothetical protein
MHGMECPELLQTKGIAMIIKIVMGLLSYFINVEFAFSLKIVDDK